MLYIIIFISIIALKFSMNLRNFLQIKRLEKRYLDFLSDKGDVTPYRQEVVSLFKKASIKDRYIAGVNPVGYGYVSTGNYSTFGNFPSKMVVFVAPTLNMFSDCKGKFVRNMKDSFSPFFWIETIIFAPKNVLDYIGLSNATVSYKLLNLLLSFVWWTSGILFMIFKSEIKDFIIKFASNL